MAIKKVISFGLDYSTIKELKERAKKVEKSTSEYLQDLIDSTFYEEKSDNKIDELNEQNAAIKKDVELINEKMKVMVNNLIEINKKIGVK